MPADTGTDCCDMGFMGFSTTSRNREPGMLGCGMPRSSLLLSQLYSAVYYFYAAVRPEVFGAASRRAAVIIFLFSSPIIVLQKLVDCNDQNSFNFEAILVLKVGIDSKFLARCGCRLIRYFPDKHVKLYTISLTITKLTSNILHYRLSSIIIVTVLYRSFLGRCQNNFSSSVFQRINYLMDNRKMTRTFFILNQI
jgi:hypothetical protein